MKHLTLLFMLLASLTMVAQNDTLLYYWVQFADKKGTPYSIDKANEFLSPRSLQRRARLNIKVDSIDLPVVPKYIEKVAKTGAKIHNISRWLNGTTIIATEGQAEKIEALKFVESVSLFNRRAAMVDTTKIDYSSGRDTTSITFNRYDSNYYNLAYSQINQLNAISLHRHGYEGQGILVGVCDGGFPGVDTLSVFDSLRRQNRIVATRDFVTHHPSVFRANDHGTMVLTTMAGYIPGRYVGTAPKANYVLCITEDSYTESPIEELNWVSAAEYLDSLGVDVINSSLGYRGFGDTSLNYKFHHLDGQTAWMSRGGNIAASRGILCVNSAGNEGGQGPSSLSSPADAPDILSIGAVWASNKIAGFSSYGPTYDNRIKPDVCAQGVLVYVASPMGGYLRANGTSFSSPIMAGVVACLRQARPFASVASIHRAVRLSADRYDRVDNRYGYGIPNANKALTLIRNQRNNNKMQVSSGIKNHNLKSNNTVSTKLVPLERKEGPNSFFAE